MEEIVEKRFDSTYPEIFAKIDTSSLNFVDNWAYVYTEKMNDKFSRVFFCLGPVKEGQEEHNIKMSTDGEIIVSDFIAIILPNNYAQSIEEILKKGIRSTAYKLAKDGMFKEALDALPTYLYIYNKDFPTVFRQEYNDRVNHDGSLSAFEKQFFKNNFYATINNIGKANHLYRVHKKAQEKKEKALEEIK